MNRQGDNENIINKIYGFPCGHSCLKGTGWAKYVPICPSYEPTCLKIKLSSQEEEGQVVIGDLGIDYKAVNMSPMESDAKEGSIDVIQTRL